MQKIIYISSNLTSAEYYGVLLAEVKAILRYYDKITKVIMDFSGTTTIEPNVIPNLLCIGNVIQSFLGFKIILRIPDTYEGGRLKQYLYSIDFLRYAGKNFDFESDPHTGFEGKIIDPLCGTVYFDKGASKDEIEWKFNRMVGPFVERYLQKYNKFYVNSGESGNDILNLLTELAANASEHAESYSYTTVHAKYSKHRIIIAVSDNGIGFLHSCKKKHAEEMKKQGIVLRNEIDAMIYGIYIRKNSMKFGLYSVINSTIQSGGVVRIHSNDSQIVFTERLKDEFGNCSMLKNPKFWKYNVKRNLKFGGTHIEIEIPF